MHFRKQTVLVPLALGLTLVACQQAAEAPSAPATETGETLDVVTPMNREITALKQREKDPVKVEAALREILPRYGHAVPAPEPRNTVAAPDRTLGPVVATDAEPLAKTSRTIIWVPSGFPAKSLYFTYNLARRVKITVPANHSVEAWTSGSTGAEDPALVAYYQTNGEPNSPAFRIRIASYNDDRGDGTQNARIYWKNNATSSRDVYIVLHAYSSLGTGSCNLTIIHPDGAKTTSSDVSFPTSPLYTNNEANPRLTTSCVGPQGSRIELKQEGNGGYGATALAVNLETMRGGVIMEANAYTQTLDLQEVLPGGGSSFLMGFVTGFGDIIRHRPHFIASQWDTYSCPVPMGL